MHNYEQSNASDAELLLRYQEGRDERAFAELVRRHGPMVMATARRVSDSQEDTEEAFQAAFFALSKAIDKLRDKSAVAGWLHRAAYSCATHIQRTNVRWDRNSEALMERPNASPSLADDPSVSVLNEERRCVIDRELAALPRHLQLAIVLCDLEGKSQTEAARSLGIPHSTFAKQIAKGRKLLRDRLLRLGFSLPAAGVATLVTSSSETHAVTPTLIAETTSKATLYAAGHSAAQIGVRESTIQTANMVVSAMKTAKMTMVCLAALALVFSMGSLMFLRTASGGTIFLDTFNDGNHDDGSPVTWAIATNVPGALDASSGDMILGRDDTSIPGRDVLAEVRDISLRNVSARSQLRVTETGGSSLISVRNPHLNTERGYFMGVSYLTQFGGSVVILGRSDDFASQVFFNAKEGVFFPPPGPGIVAVLPYDVREEDTIVQIDVFENEIHGWYRHPKGVFPEEPQFVVSDATYDGAGTIALVNSNRGSVERTGTSQSIFRYVHIADTPIHEIVLETSGDFDGNGTLDAVDLDLLNEQIKVGGNHSLFDVNNDGFVNDADRDVWVRDLAGTSLGDANLDSRVDATDLNALALSWQQSLASWARGDFTGDGLVDSADLNVLALNWQNGTNAAPVPEPSGIRLLVLAVGVASACVLGRQHLARD